MKPGKKLALLGTSQARDVEWDGNEIVSAVASARLTELLADGYEIHIVSGRTRFFPEECDKCLFDVIPAERFWLPNPKLDIGDAQSPGMVDLWTRVLIGMGVPLGYWGIWDDEPDDRHNQYHDTWLYLRDCAEKAGVIVR